MRINFDFTDLEAFLAVKDTGSFHLASRRLNLSQSSITRRVQKLEQALGSELFERTTRDVRPTLAAKRLQQRAEAILDEVHETTRAMRDESAVFAHQRARNVMIATVPTLIAGVLAPAISAFSASSGPTRVRIIDLAANEVAEVVAQGEADFGLCSIPLLEPTTEFEALFTDPIVLALPLDHPLAEREILHWADLDGTVLILPARGTGNRLVIDEALARTERNITWTYEVGRTTTALELVIAGLGVAPLPRTAISKTFLHQVSMRPLIAPEVTRPIGLLRRTGQRDGALAAALIAQIRSHVKDC